MKIERVVNFEWFTFAGLVILHKKIWKSHIFKWFKFDELVILPEENLEGS